MKESDVFGKLKEIGRPCRLKHVTVGLELWRGRRVQDWDKRVVGSFKGMGLTARVQRRKGLLSLRPLCRIAFSLLIQT